MASILIYFVFGVFVKDFTVSAIAICLTEKVYALNGENATFKTLFAQRTNEEFRQFVFKCKDSVMEAPNYVWGAPVYSGLCYKKYIGRCHTDLEPGRNDFTITVLNVSSADEGQCSLELNYHAHNTISSFSQLVVGNTSSSTGNGRVVDNTSSVHDVTMTVAYNYDYKRATFRIVITLRDDEDLDEVFFKYKSVNVFQYNFDTSSAGQFHDLYQQRGSSTFSSGTNDFTIVLTDVTSADEGQYTVDVTVKGYYSIVSYSQLVIGGANKSGSGKGAVSADRASKFLPCVASVVIAMSYTTG